MLSRSTMVAASRTTRRMARTSVKLEKEPVEDPTESRFFKKSFKQTRNIVKKETANDAEKFINTHENNNENDIKVKLEKQVDKDDDESLAVTSTSTQIKHERPVLNDKRPRKHIKVEIKVEESQDIHPTPVSATEKPQPAKFWEMYGEIKRMRSLIVSPVDTMGCANIPRTVSGNGIDDRTYRFQLLISLMMSSQTKDEVNYEVTRNLHTTFLKKGYEKGLCIEAIHDVSESELDTLIRKVGFHTRKAKYIKQTIEIMLAQHDGEVPRTIEEITAFPGVGPKMGYLLLQGAWNINTGIGVDVHMFRLANMWGWVPKKSNTPEHVRIDMEKWLPREYWSEINPNLVGFGQMICLPRGARCDLCTLAYKKLCPAVDRKLVNKAIRERKEQRELLRSSSQHGNSDDESLQTPSSTPASGPLRKSRGDLSLLVKEVQTLIDGLMLEEPSQCD